MKKKRKNLKVNITNFYIAIAFVFVLGFGFFGSSKLFIAEEVPINQTELNTQFDLRSNGKFSINSWVYDEEQNIMEVTLVTNGMKDYSTDLNFTAVSKRNLKKELPTEIVFNDNEIYILHIKKIPKNFEQLAIRLHKSENNMQDVFDEIEGKELDENSQRMISTIYTDERTVDRNVIEKKNNRTYLLEVTEEIIEETIKSKEVSNEKIEKINTLNETLDEEISKFKKELLYETLDEQVETNNKIYRLEREVEANKKTIEELQQDIKNMDLKIERLKQKIRDISL